MTLPDELRTWLAIVASDIRIAADLLPGVREVDPYTGVVSQRRCPLRERLLNHSRQAEQYSDEIARMNEPKGPGPESF